MGSDKMEKMQRNNLKSLESDQLEGSQKSNEKSVPNRQISEMDI